MGSAADLLLGPGTKGRILDELTLGSRTAGEISARLHIQESAVRTHLERLVRQGVVASSFHREGVGRPRKRFQLTQEGQELFPRRYELLLNSVIDAAVEDRGEGYLSILFLRAADLLADRLLERAPALAQTVDPRKRLQLAAQLLDQLGQKVEVIERNGAPQLIRHNCVFRATAVSHPHLLCEVFDRRLLERLIGPTEMKLGTSISHGGTACQHLIQILPA
jgi:predicted ArsR family transcriptional regulator